MRSRNDLSRFVREIEQRIQRAVDSSHLKELGEEAIRLIKTRTRLGFGVASQGEERQPLAPLSDRYVEFRRANAADLSGETTPGKSNLTLSGQMLDSMQVTQARSGEVIIGPTGARSGPFAGDATNREVAAHVARRRPFIHLSRLEFEQLVAFYRKRFSDLFRR